MTNWNIYFICQRSTNEVLQSSNDGIKTIATNIPKFNELERLKFDYSRIANELKFCCPSRKPITPNITTRVNQATVKANLKDPLSQKESENEVPQKRSRHSA